MSTFPASTTSIQFPACPACGCQPHHGGVGACPEVAEVEFDVNGRVRKIVKRPQPNYVRPQTPHLTFTVNDGDPGEWQPADIEPEVAS